MSYYYHNLYKQVQILHKIVTKQITLITITNKRIDKLNYIIKKIKKN